VVFVWELLLGSRLELPRGVGFVPAHLFQSAVAGPGLAWALVTVLTSMFLPRWVPAPLGNMWFLWVFATTSRDALGHAGFVVFYLVCGAAAALAQAVIRPTRPCR